jgi:hypothetical protein
VLRALAVALALPQAAGATITLPAGYQMRVFATGSSSASKPDDITRLGNTIFATYQNNAGPDGMPTGSTSTVVAYRPDGSQRGSWSLLGRCDGLTADPEWGIVIATVNEDSSSSVYTINPDARPSRQLRHYMYSPDPMDLSGGGTDAITILDGQVFVSASNPSPDTVSGSTFSRPALFRLKIPRHGSTAFLTPAFADNAQATDAVSGQSVTLNLSDADSNATVPSSSPRFGGQLMLDSQGDSELVFATDPLSPSGQLTLLTLTSSAGAPQVVVGWATSRRATLLVADQSQDQIDAITGPFGVGTVITAIPNDSQALARDLGTIDLQTGDVTPFASGFGSPKGLLFLGRGAGQNNQGGQGDHGGQGDQGGQGGHGGPGDQGGQGDQGR